MKNLHERFSSIDLLNFLFTKLGFIFHSQQYLIAILDEALRRSRMVAVLGREGMGKSSAIAKFVQDNPQVYYLRIGKSYAITHFFNEMLYQVTGVYPAVYETLFVKMKMLSHALTKDNTRRLIIVDDCGALSAKALSVFFELRDNTINTTGFVFVGLDYFQKNLMQARKNGVPGIAEFYRRVENWYDMPRLQKNESAAYGKQRGMTDDQVLQLNSSEAETIAELENMANAILEEEEAAKKEERAPKKIKVPGQEVQTEHRDAPRKDEEDEEDELEEEIVRKKKEGARKARAAKKAKQKTTSGDASA
ncbi:MAG TPA: AAA family ATPase [Cyclobacteriaceae bacterium]|jgi:DNA transposition AAA+ family ATPase|nr:AAA family ATPase [Cyclobacteriaceae bacterium]